MAYLKYYANEHKRHADVLPVKWTLEQCREAVRDLCVKFNLPAVPVLIRRGKKVKSFYRAANAVSERIIHMHADMLSPLHIAHEFAHYRDHMYRIAQRDAKNAHRAKLGGSLVGIDTKTRWHGARHLRFTDAAVRCVKNMSSYKAAQTAMKTSRMARIVNVGTNLKALADRRIQAAYDALHSSLTCPKCHHSKDKSKFGVRVMSHDAKGLPERIIRQSYCRHCRSVGK